MADDDRTEKLKAVLFREETQARAWQDGELTSHRQKSLQYYQRDPLGDEEPGQSQIVTSEYADTVESIMPALMRTFTQGDSVVEFSPDRQEDEQWAEEASGYIPHVLMRENDGFLFHYWFIKDALMYRLAWAAVDLEEVEQVKSKAFGPVPADAFAVLSQEATAMAQKLGAEAEIEGAPDEQGMVSGKITTRRKVKKVVVDNIAPEDGRVSPGARHIDEAGMAGYRKKVTASELKTLGMSEEAIKDLGSDENYTAEQAQRQPDVIQTAQDRDGDDDSERQLWVVLAYVKFDWDDDGISEMRRVLYAHAGGQVSEIIENEEWTDGVAPIVPGTPVLMSHTIPGRSIFDMVKDIQDIKTAVTRGMLNNMYLVNHPRPAVTDKVDLASLIDWTPGMPIRMRQGVTNPAEHIQWQIPTPIMDKALAVNQHFDEVLQRRTGVASNQQGVLDENMNPTAQGAALATAAADARTELIARTLGETAFKRLYRLIYRAVKRAATGPVTYRSADDWVTVDPTKWPDDMALEVNVGLGAGNKQQQLQHLGLVAQGQEKLIQAQGGPNGPAIKLPHIANTFRKLIQTVGIKATDRYVSNDQEIAQGVAEQQANPPPNPEMAKAQGQIQATVAKNQADAQLAQQKHAADVQADQAKAANDLAIQRMKVEGELQVQREKFMGEIALRREEMEMEFALKRQELAEEMRLKELAIRQKTAGPDSTNIQEQEIDRDE